MITLLDLEPRLLKAIDAHSWREVDGPIAEADGLCFLCPVCFLANGGAVGTHSIICWTPKVSPDMRPRPGRWNMRGTSLADLSLVAGSSSILLTSGCRAHFFITNGEIP